MKTRLPAALLSLALSSPLCAADEPVQIPVLEFAAGLPGKQVRLTWNAEVGVRYRVERSTNLGGGGGGGGGAGGWKQLALVEASSTEGKWLDPEPVAEKCFYRIVQPQAEVFEIVEPVLPPTGGELVIHGQRIPDGSKLVISVDGVPQEVALTAMGGGLWRASLVGGMLPGGAIISAIAVKDPSGTTLVTFDFPISITATGRATDSPPSLPPGAPLASSSAVSSVGALANGGGGAAAASYAATGFVISGGGGSSSYGDDSDADLSAAWLSKKGYDYYQARSDNAAAALQSNPLYQDKGHQGSNPLYQGRSLKVVNNHAINTKGAGANVGRVIPSSSGLPGEVSLRHVSLEVPCPAGPALSWVCTYRSKVPVSSGLGNGWDFSYNISVQPVPLAAGPNAPRVIVRDGGGRADVFYRQPNGSYRCDGMFREGSFRNGVFTLTFANAGRWVFRPLDGSPSSGKISSIVDRNEVALTCTYDSSGLLSRVNDGFDRSLAVGWSGSPSRIESVTAQDGTGSISYQKIEYHYLSSGDRLASVTSPFTPGSPPPEGPVSFAYSDGLSDPNLNGNLLSVHDGGGHLMEGFEYSTATDPLSPDYDTCSGHDRHSDGGAGPHVRTTFAVLLGGGGGSGGSYECVDNDEMGRVTVTTFDKLHRVIGERCYTGFATPDMPVTTTKLPDPSTKLRSTDPDYFETTCTYNADSLCTRITYPDGSRERVVFDRDFRKDCPVRERGNARVVTLVSPGSEERTVSCDHLPGFGSPEAARPGNPIGGLSIKGGKNPGGNIGGSRLIWSPRSNFLSDDCDDADPISAKISGINGGMPNRISMNVTTPKQTQGATFGEKVAGGLHAAGSALSQGASLRVKSPRNASSGLATGRRQHSAVAMIDDTDVAGASAIMDDEDCDGFVSKVDHSGASDASAGITYIGTCDAQTYVGPCDASFVTRIVTAHGQAFSFGYDGRGNLTSESGAVAGSGAQFTYNTRGQLTTCTMNDDSDADSSFSKTVMYDDTDGFASSVTTDPEGIAITTVFGRDDLGRLTSVTDPLNHVWSYGYDLGGNLVTITSPPSPSPIVTTLVRDGAGRMCRVDTSHLDEDGQVMVENPLYSAFCVYDDRGRLVRVAQEQRPVDCSGVLDPASLGLENFAVCDFTLDHAGQVTRVSTPAISRGQSVDQDCDFTYDERGLPYQIIEGGTGSTAPVITTTDYDACGAPVRVLAGVGGGVPAPQVSISWDGFHRLSSVTDPMGNVASLSYDNQGFVTTTLMGEVQDLPGSASNVLLYRSASRGGGPSLRAFNQNSSRSNNASAKSCAYNQNNARSNHARAYNQNSARSNHARLCLTSDLFFDVFTADDTCIEERFTPGTAGETGVETTTVHRSLAGLPLSITCNGDNLGTMEYDTAGRVVKFVCTDTTTALTRDKKGNVTVCGDTDHFLVQGVPDKTFTLTYVYDALGRCTSITDGVGNSSSCQWDSLGRCVSSTQPGGLVVTMVYDGGTATGPFSQQVIADVDGDGKAEVLSSSLVCAGELVSCDDSYGHRTSIIRDELGRVTRCNYPDGTYEENTFDSLGRASSHRRKNGAIIAADYNYRSEITSISYSSLPAGVIPVAPTAFSYNGLGDCVRCEQGASVVQWTFDSVGDAISETQGGRTVSRSFNHRGRTGITYPDGSRFVESRNALGYLLSVSKLNAVGVPVSPPVAVLQYAGDRVWRSTQANGVVTTYTYRGDSPPNGADFSFDACVDMTVSSSLIGHELTHVVQQRNRDQQVVSRHQLFTESPQGPGRLQSFTRDPLGRVTGSLTRRREAIGAPPVIEQSVSYILGKEGQRVQELRNGVTGDYTQDPALPPGDQQMGQYTTWPGGPIEWDESGNLRNIHRGSVMHAYQYDAAGRLVAVTDPSGGLTLVSYVYDAIGRRVSSTASAGAGVPPVTTEFIYDGSTCLQEWTDDGSGTGTTSAAVTFANADGVNYGITTRSGTTFHPVPYEPAFGVHRGIGSPCGHGNREASSGLATGRRTCTCTPGWSAATKNKVEHWGDPHENLNGKHIKDWEGKSLTMLTNSAGEVTERFDCDDAGLPIFLSAAGVPTGAASAVGPVRWCAPECLWEPSIRMIVCPSGIYSPDLGATVAVQDHNSSRSNKSSN